MVGADYLYGVHRARRTFLALCIGGIGGPLVRAQKPPVNIRLELTPDDELVSAEYGASLSMTVTKLEFGNVMEGRVTFKEGVVAILSVTGAITKPDPSKNETLGLVTLGFRGPGVFVIATVDGRNVTAQDKIVRVQINNAGSNERIEGKFDLGSQTLQGLDQKNFDLDNHLIPKTTIEKIKPLESTLNKEAEKISKQPPAKNSVKGQVCKVACVTGATALTILACLGTKGIGCRAATIALAAASSLCTSHCPV